VVIGFAELSEFQELHPAGICQVQIPDSYNNFPLVPTLRRGNGIGVKTQEDSNQYENLSNFHVFECFFIPPNKYAVFSDKLTSGVYFYRIETENNIETKKMII